MMTFAEVMTLNVQVRKLGVTVLEPITRYLELHEVAGELITNAPTRVLDLSDDDVRSWIREQSFRAHSVGLAEGGYRPGSEAFRNALASELRDASLPFIGELIVSLQTRFEAAAAPLVEAVRVHGFSKATTAETVLDLNDASAIDAWRAVRPR